MGNDNLDIVLDRIDQLQTEAVDLMKAIVPIRALGPLNGGEGESVKAEYIENYLKKIGFTNIRHFPAKDESVPSAERPNIAAVLTGAFGRCSRRRSFQMGYGSL